MKKNLIKYLKQYKEIINIKSNKYMILNLIKKNLNPMILIKYLL